MPSGIFELAIVILLAAVLGILAKLLRQPLILAFILTGVIIGYFGFLNLNDQTTFNTFSDLGIMFLLFLIGLEINYASLKTVGKVSLLTGIGQIIFTSAIGFAIAYLFGFNYLHSLYIAVALTFSSTIIIVKLLSEKKDTNSLYGKISIGFLLIQDFVAILILVLLTGIQAGKGLVITDILLVFLKGAAIFFLILWLGRKIIPILLDKIARSQELLFLISLAWVFLMVTLVKKIGFSIEIGGFLAGLALANSSEHYQIANKIKSLRDFFILIFFVILGSSIIFSDFSGLTLPIIVFSLFVLIGNPLIVLIIMGLMGYKKRTSFLCGTTVAQISEFSLILAALGLKVGHINESIVALITAVGIITITLSTYLILNANQIFHKLSSFLSFFERKNTKENGLPSEKFKKSIILMGSHRTGQSIAFNIPKEDLLIIDFDPEVIVEIKKYGYDYLFGDIEDEEILGKIDLSYVKLIISTIPDIQNNLAFLEYIKKIKDQWPAIKVIVRADSDNELKLLYAKGADYVLFPHFTSGQYLGRSIAIDPQMKIIGHLRDWDLKTLQKLEHHNH